MEPSGARLVAPAAQSEHGARMTSSRTSLARRICISRGRHIAEYTIRGEVASARMRTADRRRKTFRGLLARESGRHADAMASAAAARRVFERFVQQLSPIIGAAGVEAICLRSVHQTRRQFPSLAPIPLTGNPFAHLETLLPREDSDATLDVAAAILATACDLLDTFIGQSLTARLLQGAWPDDFHDGTKETL